MQEMNREFRTRRLHHASYLIAGCVLQFVKAEFVNGRVELIFSDPDGIGPESERTFDNGALVPANQIFSATTYLRRQMDRIRIESGESHVSYSRQ